MIFIASVEVKPLPGSEMSKKSAGGLVYCFIPANSKTAASKRLQAALDEDKYELVQVELFDEYENFRWEEPEDQIEYDRLAKRAAVNDDVIYGPFYTWESDE